MQMKTRRVEIRVDRYTQVCLTMIAGLLTLLIAGLWVGSDYGVNTAGAQEAQGEDTAKKMLAAQEKTNATLEQVITVLRSGEVKVQLMKRPPEADRK